MNESAKPRLAVVKPINVLPNMSLREVATMAAHMAGQDVVIWREELAAAAHHAQVIAESTDIPYPAGVRGVARRLAQQLRAEIVVLGGQIGTMT